MIIDDIAIESNLLHTLGSKFDFRSDHARRHPDRDQEQRVPRRHHPGRRGRTDPSWSRGVDSGRRWRRFGDLRLPTSSAAGAQMINSVDEVWAEADLLLKVKEPIEPEYAPHARGPDAVHLSASGRLQAVHRRTAGFGHHIDRLRNRADRRRRAAAAGPDERGRRPALGAGRRVPPDAQPRRPRCPDGRRARRGPRRGRRHRRRRGRLQRRPHRQGDGRSRLCLRRQRQHAAQDRQREQRGHRDPLLVHARPRGRGQAGRPGDRCGAGARRQGARSWSRIRPSRI